MFREQAVKAYLDPDLRGGLLRVTPPWLLSVFAPVAALCVAALVGAFVGEVEVHAVGRGVVRPADGIRKVEAPIAGWVGSLAAREGDRIESGQTLLVLADPDFEQDLERARRELELEGRNLAALEAQIEVSRERRRAIRANREALTRRIAERQGELRAVFQSLLVARGAALPDESSAADPRAETERLARLESHRALLATLETQAKTLTAFLESARRSEENLRKRLETEEGLVRRGVESESELLDRRNETEAMLRESTRVQAEIDAIREKLVRAERGLAEEGWMARTTVEEGRVRSLLEEQQYLLEESRWALDE